MSTAKEKGYEGMLYSSKFYLETIWHGHIDGINGDVDIDVLYK